MSLTFEAYQNGKEYVEYRWNRNNGYEVISGTIVGEMVISNKTLVYGTKEQARKSFKRKVAKIKKGE